MAPQVLSLGPDDDLTAAARSGRILELRPGRYLRDLLLTGVEDLVLQVPAETSDEVCFWRCGIRLADVRRVRLQGLVFRQAPATALVIEGPSQAVTVAGCAFLACGMPGGGVTLWLGQGTAGCTVDWTVAVSTPAVCAPRAMPNPAMSTTSP